MAKTDDRYWKNELLKEFNNETIALKRENELYEKESFLGVAFNM